MLLLGPQFYRRKNVVTIARELLGKIIQTRVEGVTTSARIVETEAYRGEGDRASHAFGGRRTRRTEVMYGDGGVAYIYLCYGIHHLFNVVTNNKDIPHAVLIRAGEPVEGIADMLVRAGKAKPDISLTRGPGNLSRALGIYTSLSGTSLSGNEINIFDDGTRYKPAEIGVSPRIGVDYAGDDALLPYRFYVKGNRYVSGRVKK
jgi:DNA-3-methyladenine glycosylase